MNKGTDRNILTELNITSNEYNLVTVLYTVCGLVSAVVMIDANHSQVPYIVAEIPSNLLLKKFRPSRWQSRIMLSWYVRLDLYATKMDADQISKGHRHRVYGCSSQHGRSLRLSLLPWSSALLDTECFVRLCADMMARLRLVCSRA